MARHTRSRTMPLHQVHALGRSPLGPSPLRRLWTSIHDSIVMSGSVRVLLMTVFVALYGVTTEAQRTPGTSDGADRTKALDSVSARLTRELRVGGRAVLREIRFAGSKDTLMTASDSVVRGLAEALRAFPGDFLIEGHVASSGDANADIARTDRRAAALKSSLVRYGVPSARLVTMGYGATKRPRALPNGQPAPENRIEVSRIP